MPCEPARPSVKSPMLLPRTGATTARPPSEAFVVRSPRLILDYQCRWSKPSVLSSARLRHALLRTNLIERRLPPKTPNAHVRVSLPGGPRVREILSLHQRRAFPVPVPHMREYG